MGHRTIALLLAGLLGLPVLAGCTNAQMQEWDRTFWGKEPEGFDKYPLGESYDTRDEIATLKDEQIRNLMGQWMDHHDEYLKLWRKYDDNDQRVIRIKNRLQVIEAYIQDRATQLHAMGQPLS